MHITLAHVGARLNSQDPCESLAAMYLTRCSPYAQCSSIAYRTESALLEGLARLHGRTPALLILLDSRGRQLSSEAFASWIGARRDEGAQHLVFAIGPADGWSPEALKRANLALSLGTLTLAHALARVVAAEQIYRAFTILAGHPYHTGH